MATIQSSSPSDSTQFFSQTPPSTLSDHQPRSAATPSISLNEMNDALDPHPELREEEPALLRVLTADQSYYPGFRIKEAALFNPDVFSRASWMSSRRLPIKKVKCRRGSYGGSRILSPPGSRQITSAPQVAARQLLLKICLTQIMERCWLLRSRISVTKTNSIMRFLKAAS